MLNRWPLVAFLLILTSAAAARADGKFYARERVPPGVPYQRAILMYDDGKETLVLQSKFSASGKPESGETLGWVVPVPNVPEMDSIDSKKAFNLFWYLDRRSAPSVIKVPTGVIAWFCLTILLVVGGRVFCRPKARPFDLVVCSLLLAIIMAIGIPSLAGSKPGVEILAESNVGIYQAKVLKATDSAALLAWLNEGGFQFQPSDQPILDDYIRRGWCFVVAKVKPGEEKKALGDYDGLPDPLILRFASKAPVYPLALTGTTGAPTEVLLYVLGRSKMRCDGRLSLRFAGDRISFDGMSDEYTSALRPWEKQLDWLCKFKGTLTPEQMRTDLELAPAADNEPYRETIVKW